MPSIARRMTSKSTHLPQFSFANLICVHQTFFVIKFFYSIDKKYCYATLFEAEGAEKEEEDIEKP